MGLDLCLVFDSKETFARDQTHWIQDSRDHRKPTYIAMIAVASSERFS